MKRLLATMGVTLGLLALGYFVAAQIDLIPFKAGEVIRADEVNQNFQNLAAAIGAGELPKGCDAGEMAEWDGTAWVCGPGGASGGGGGGDITGVTAGAGLRGGGSSGDVTLEIAFAGTGNATTAARSDHDHDGRYYTEAEVDGAISAAVSAIPGAEAVLSAGVNIPEPLTVQHEFSLSETVTTTRAGKLLVTDFFAGQLACEVANAGQFYFLLLDGEPVRSSTVFWPSSPTGFSGQLSGVTEDSVAAGEHTLSIGGQCSQGGLQGWTQYIITISSVVVLPD